MPKDPNPHRSTSSSGAASPSRRRPGPPARADRHAWIRAAIRQMAETGQIGVNVEALARSLRITKGSFYNYFSGADALTHEALRYWVDRERARVNEALEEAGLNDERPADPAKVRELVEGNVNRDHRAIVIGLVAGGAQSPYAGYLRELAAFRIQVGRRLLERLGEPEPLRRAVHAFYFYLGSLMAAGVELSPEHRGAVAGEHLADLLFEYFWTHPEVDA